MSIVYLNGEFLPLEHAQISPMDRGFLFSDAIYEVIPVFDGRLFRISEHLKRLKNSLKAVRIEVDLTADQWRKLLKTLVAKNGGGDLVLYIQVSRGTESTRNHAFPQVMQPTLFARVSPLERLPMQRLQQGFTAITLPDSRHRNCYIKATCLLPNVLMMQQAIDAGVDEAILIDDGYALEANTSNLFIVKDGALVTTPAIPQILGGITRGLVIELAHKNKIPCIERMIPEADLRNADEIWLSNSTKDIRPVIQLDNAPVGNGKPGQLWQQMYTIIQDYKQQYADD